MKAIFFDGSGTLRSGWRAAMFLLAFFFPAVFVGVANDLIERYHIFGLHRGSGELLFGNPFVLLIATVLIAWACGSVLEGLPFSALGAALTGGWLRNLGIGLGFGAATLGVAVAAASIFGGLSFEINPDLQALPFFRSMAASFAIFAAAAAFEEAFFRGYLLQTFARSGLAWLAIAITSLLFGYVHMDNPNAGVVSTLNTVLAGLWFSVAYLKTRDLWFVWGLHLMWNWMQGSIFGIEVSGITRISKVPLLKEIDGGPPWLTGGTYGLEGGLACTVAIVISIAAIYCLPKIGVQVQDETLEVRSGK
ncbi:MAG: lysostaphin resistance A-like protein [Pyrinomonadaceae bacterium]